MTVVALSWGHSVFYGSSVNLFIIIVIVTVTFAPSPVVVLTPIVEHDLPERRIFVAPVQLTNY